MPRSHPDLVSVLSHVRRVDRANNRLGLTSFHEMSDGSARTLARRRHRSTSRDVDTLLDEGAVFYDPSGRRWPALLPASYATLDAAERLLADYLGTYLLHHARRGAVPEWLHLPVDELPSDRYAAERWYAVTESGVPYVVPDRGNSGTGPVSIWHDGHLVSVRTRHRLDTDTCPSCADPARRRTYLPPALWRTPDVTGRPRLAPLDPRRGRFHAIFSGGPDHPSRRMTAEVSRLSASNMWTPYERVAFAATGDWLGAFDRWRTDATGYRRPITGTPR
ncbi:hypothetical protein [Amycolatopsis sp. NBC_01480]|uniref:hypothetical protein n=1 Tax=Amycolatopsis sp. NBC_01480 TaxID=2903562 RepID=UPI002E2DC181|nr:hypothetical protein [Amycolatopsis sp. NBC_01480]